MDPAELKKALSFQGATIGQHEALLHQVMETLEQLSWLVVGVYPAHRRYSCCPFSYSSGVGGCSSPTTATDPILCSNFQAFSQEMRKVFDHPIKGREAVSQLLSLTQGNQSVFKYSVSAFLQPRLNGIQQLCRECF